MICPAKHTKYQPADKDWKCPRCGGDNTVFTINESAAEALDDCERVHDEDEVRCSKCDMRWTGKQVTALLAKNLDLVECPHCKGKGMVPKDKTNPS